MLRLSSTDSFYRLQRYWLHLVLLHFSRTTCEPGRRWSRAIGIRGAHAKPWMLRVRHVVPALALGGCRCLEPLAKLVRHVGWTVIAQQPWPMQNLDLVQT